MFRHFFRSTLLLLALAVLVVACGDDDNPIVDDDHADEPFHADADGFVLKVDGNEIYRQFQGTQTGGITLKARDELDVLAVFLDHDADEFFPSSPEADEDHDHDHEDEEVFALGLSGFDASIIEVHLHEGEEHEHEEEEEEHAEKLTFEVVGLKAGQTQINFQLLHGGHADFTAALAIPVNVTP